MFIGFHNRVSQSVQFSHSVIFNSLLPHGLQHARPPCPSPTPRACWNSYPSSRWCHLILCCPHLLLPPIHPSIRVFSNESALHMRWPKYWSFTFNISPSNEHPGLISFRMDWLDLSAVQGILKSLLQHHNSKAFIHVDIWQKPSQYFKVKSVLGIEFNFWKCIWSMAIKTWATVKSVIILNKDTDSKRC